MTAFRFPAPLVLFLLGSLPNHAETLAWWRFEGGTDGANVVHGAATGAFSADIPDSSGHGNDLSVWETAGDAGFVYRTDVAVSPLPQTGGVNSTSLQNTGGGPNLFTSTSSPIHGISPLAWTIEVIFKPENGGHRTFVGRDSQGAIGNASNSGLYLQARPDDSLGILFTDAAGHFHQAISMPGLVEGFDWPTDPTGSTGQWQAAVAVSDGSTLRLYYRNLSAGDPEFSIVAELDLSASASGNTALGAGMGSGSVWTGGTWTVGRGLYAGNHTDRAYGFLDEVRISDHARNPSEFLLSSRSLSLASFTIDCGGGKSTGGAFSLTGTMGQADASGALTGGTLDLAGGYWGVGSPVVPGGYAAWASGNISPGADTSFGGDADGNGIPNGLAYALGNDFAIFAAPGFLTGPPADLPEDIDLILEQSASLEEGSWLPVLIWEGGLLVHVHSGLTGYTPPDDIPLSAISIAPTGFFRYRADFLP